MFKSLLAVLTTASLSNSSYFGNSSHPNNCIQFSVGAGTGCAWMCSYCANQLGTNNYYFTNNVCTYQTGGCVGNPVAGTMYTCCSAN